MLTKTSVENLLKRLMILASRTLVEFNKYEALELVDALKNAAHDHDSKHEKEAYYRSSLRCCEGSLISPMMSSSAWRQRPREGLGCGS